MEDNNDGFHTASFIIELRDEGTYGFLLPANQVSGTLNSVLAPVGVMAEHTVFSYNALLHTHPHIKLQLNSFDR